MLKKVLSVSLFFSLLTYPVFAHQHEEHHDHVHKHEQKMKMNFHYHKIDENTVKMMKENYDSAKVLFNKGLELVKEASNNSSVEKMLEGLSLLRLSMDISYHPFMKMMIKPYKQECEACKLKKDHHKEKENSECKECSLQKKQHEEFLKKIGYSEEEHKKMLKDLEEVVLMSMSTGNKLIKEGNQENNTSKIKNGGKIIKEALMIHHRNNMMKHVNHMH